MRRKKRHKVKPTEEKSLLGRIIDLPLEDFKEELVNQKVSLGVMCNVRLSLTSAYQELVLRKEAIMKNIASNAFSQDDPKVKSTLEGIYAELTKIEGKVTYLSEVINDLMDLDKKDENTVVDSPKE